jgi:Zn-dependent M28 family amino/carboxypeptidase
MSDPPPSLDHLDLAARLGVHVEMLAGAIGERHMWRPSALYRAADYIKQTFAASGYTPGVLGYELHGIRVENVEAVLHGSTRSEQTLVVGAHYDSVPGCPGANDNGTGVAAVLELARRFAAMPRARSVRFVAFVNEEPPWFLTPSMGSVVYATAARRRGDRLVGMLSLETIGYYSDEPGSQRYPPPLNLLYPAIGNFIGFVSNVRSARLLRKAVAAFKSRTSFPIRNAAAPAAIPGVGWSDHWSFWQAGYPAVMVTDTAPYRYPWYHTPEDTPEKIVLDRFAAVVDGLEQVVHVLAGGVTPWSDPATAL